MVGDPVPRSITSATTVPPSRGATHPLAADAG